MDFVFDDINIGSLGEAIFQYRKEKAREGKVCSMGYPTHIIMNTKNYTQLFYSINSASEATELQKEKKYNGMTIVECNHWPKNQITLLQ